MTQYNLSVILEIPCSRPPVCGCADGDDSGSGQAVSDELTHPDLSFDLTGQVNFPTVISGLQLPTIGTVWGNRKKCPNLIRQRNKPTKSILQSPDKQQMPTIQNGKIHL